MKPTVKYDASLLKNEDKFTDDFYKRFTLRPFTLALDDKISKTYRFPTLYGDVTCSQGIFTCSYDKAASILPSGLKPVLLKAGKAIVAFSCYEYKDVMNVPPYNEIAMTIPVMAGKGINIPALPMLFGSLFKRFGYYVFRMPVTSLENQIRGLKIWGLPKVVEEIDIVHEGDKCVTTAFNAEGKPYFEFTSLQTGTPKAFDVTSNLYSVLDGKLLRAKTCFKAPFNVNKKFAEPCLKLYGETPEGKFLENLEIDPKPFQLRYAEHMTACFDLPEGK
jgi:Acetoacetate decarboxylase (ADC).